MAQRMNAFTVAPDGLAALRGVEKYLHACGLAPKLLTLGSHAKASITHANHAASRSVSTIGHKQRIELPDRLRFGS